MNEYMMSEYMMRWARVEDSVDELNMLARLDGIIKARIKRIDELRHRVTSLQSPIKSVIVQGGPDGSNDPLTRLLDEQIDARIEIDQYVDLKQSIYKRIKSMDDPLLSEILILRYIDCLDWEEISLCLHYSPQHLRTDLHINAIEAFADQQNQQR